MLDRYFFRLENPTNIEQDNDDEQEMKSAGINVNREVAEDDREEMGWEMRAVQLQSMVDEMEKQQVEMNTEVKVKVESYQAEITRLQNALNEKNVASTVDVLEKDSEKKGMLLDVLARQNLMLFWSR